MNRPKARTKVAHGFALVVAIAAVASPAKAGGETVPGEFIIHWKKAPAESIAPAASPTRLETRSATTTHFIAPQIPQHLFNLVRSRRSLPGHAELIELKPGPPAQSAALIEEIRAKSDVELVEPNRIRRISDTGSGTGSNTGSGTGNGSTSFGTAVGPNDPLWDQQWHLRAVDLPRAWARTRGNPEVVVAVIDTGIIANHPELKGRLLQGYDFISDHKNAGDGDGRDNDPTDEGSNSPQSSGFHGTHVAGIIGAQSNNNTGITGVDWNCKILPVRALGIDGGRGNDADIAAAILWAAGIHVDGVPLNAHPADVINLSFGDEGESHILEKAIREAQARGAIVVAAAGNANRDLSEVVWYPAEVDGVIVVGATNVHNARASYSNFGPAVDVMAPGGDSNQGILSIMYYPANASDEFGYTRIEGTSQAAPLVTGIVALLKGRDPTLTAPTVLEALIYNATPLNYCTEGCGAGLVNADYSLAYLRFLQSQGESAISSTDPGVNNDDPREITVYGTAGCALVPQDTPDTSSSLWFSFLFLFLLAARRRKH